MKKRMRFFAAIAALTLAASAQAETLTLGTVHENPRKQISHFAPLALYLETRLQDHAITNVEIAVLPTSDDMARALRAGDVDLYFDSPLVASRVARQAGATPILRRWKDGMERYRSYIVVSQSSDINTLSDLRGQAIAFEEPDSSSGFILPAALMVQAGLSIRALYGPGDAPNEDEVGYLQTRDDRNTMLWLVKGTVNAAAIDQESWDLLNAVRPGEFRVLARSLYVPREIVVQRDGINEPLADALRQVLIAMENSSEGARALEAFDQTVRFDDFPLGVTATFAPIYDVLDSLAEAGLM